MQSILEAEKEGKLPFLDVLMEMESDGTASTTVYRKPTHTDKYLDFELHHPANHKAAVVTTLFSRTVSRI